MNTSYIISPIAAMLLTHILIFVFRKIALKINLVDKPNHRKVHNDAVPLIGGVSIFVATSLVLLMAIDSSIAQYKTIVVSSLILLIIGVIDDRFDLRAILKLGIQLMIAHFLFVQGIKIESFFGLFGIYELAPWFQYVLTISIITGVVNAFNLMDGIDGLAAGIAILGFIVLTILSIITDQQMMTLIFLTFIGSLLMFLKFNLSKDKKIFMGDAGSTFIGFVIVVSCLQLIQSAHNSQYLYTIILAVVAILSVPVLDALRVFIGRMKSGKSPFHADRTHLHHLVIGLGLKHIKATISIIIFSFAIVIVGCSFFSYIGFTLSVGAMFLLFYLVTKALTFNTKLNHWKTFIKEIE